MTNKVKLHVGYDGITEEGERVNIVGETNNPTYPFKGDNGETYTKNGWYYLDTPNSRLNIIGPWIEDNTEYEPNVWHGWNGGECPVHPETVIKARSLSGNTALMKAMHANWEFGGSFRIVTPYVEPRKPREVWIVDGAHVYDDKSVALEDMADFNSKDIAHFREVIEADDQ